MKGVTIVEEPGNRACLFGSMENVKLTVKENIKSADYFYSYIREGMVIYNWSDHKHLFEDSLEGESDE